MLTDEQRKIRANKIGSSDIAAIVGENPFRTPYEAWAEKCGLLVNDRGSTIATELGHFLEPFIARLWEQDTGEALRLCQETVVDGHRCATADYRSVTDERIVECKSIGARVAHHWDVEAADGTPPYVQTQAQWQMGVTKTQHNDVAALFLGFTDFKIFRFEFDAELYGMLDERAAEFMRRVEAQEPPPPDHTEACRKVLQKLYSMKRPELVRATPEVEDLVEVVLEIEGRIKCDGERLSKAKNRLRAIIGEGAGFWGDFGKVTWKEAKDKKRPLRIWPRKEKAA